VNRRVIRPFFGVVLFGLLAGCSSGSSVTEVEGTVTLNGKPLDNVRVEFLPDPEAKTSGPRSTGVTDAGGRFKLTCENERSGAVVGTHRVTLTDLKQWEGLTAKREDANKPLKPSRLPERYTDVVKTPFRGVEVKPGGPPVKLEVTSP
jgi:hypothetical protein